MPKLVFKGYSVDYECSDEVKDAIFERVIQYFIEHEVFHGESIHQMDNPIIDAPNVMSDICDNIIKFDVKYTSDMC